jgi:excisionase family DNA binding protein
MTNELARIIANPESLAGIPREEIPILLVQIASLQSTLAAKLLESIPKTATDFSKPDCLITVDMAAERLAFTSQYLYELIRKGLFPAIREGKYLRIRESDLSAWIDRHREKELDNELYHPYSMFNGRERTSKDQTINGAYTGTNGRSNRRQGKHNRPLGTGRIEDIRARIKIHSASGTDQKTGKPEE